MPNRRTETYLGLVTAALLVASGAGVVTATKAPIMAGLAPARDAVSAAVASSAPAPTAPAPTAPAPTAPAPTASALPLPIGLSGLWLGALPATPVPGQSRAVLQITPSGELSYDTPDTHFASHATSATPGSLQLVATASGDCDAGALGTFAYALSPGGTLLTVQPGSDACPARGADLANHWEHVHCTNPSGEWCLGDLEAEQYSSMFTDPRLPPGADAVHGAHFWAISYRVPAGWANSADSYTHYELARASDYDRADFWSTPPAATIDIFPRPAAARQDANCDPSTDPSVGTGADDLAAWVAAHPGLVAGPVTPVVIGGLHGDIVDVDIAPSWTQGCTGFDGPVVELLAESPSSPDSNWWYGTGGAAAGTPDPIRFVLLDLGDGQTVLVTIDTSDPAQQAAWVAEAMPIVQTLTFGPG
jgi:hypothetical protein